MLKGLGNLAGMLKQAQQMGGQLQSMTDELKLRRASGAAGGGMVTVEVNGIGEVLSCRIDPSIAADRELVEDLLPAAVNQALANAKALHVEAMSSLAGGLNLPGLGEMLSQVTAPGGGPADKPSQPGAGPSQPGAQAGRS